ncbi:MAG: hypothetical protein KZQ73_03875 [Candidatus Thiodiazotropha sp. (ex Semelilucina semeliformis)]|nr:hypothetical protein [Candidatus Thiodiazotropha sp. (ex Semelilucina semeliformis)]
MALAVTLIDETTSGEVMGKTTLRLVSERITLRELIISVFVKRLIYSTGKKHKISLAG